MIIANDRYQNRVSIDDAASSEPYFCPICNQPLIQRRGEIRQPHFAHIGIRGGFEPCRDSWKYDKSDWHIDWQKRFPKNCYEKVVSIGEEKHIADVLINNTVIEFQHSSINLEDFNDRNTFYKKAGYNVVWVFDVMEQYSEEKLDHKWCKEDEFTWSNPLKLFRELDMKNQTATIYFQLYVPEDEDSNALFRVKSAYNRFTGFYTDRNCAFSINEFVSYMSNSIEKIIPPKIERPEAPAFIEGGKTIYQLWKPTYKSMVVKNLFTNKEMLISGTEGHMKHQNGNNQGHIVGKYTSVGPNSTIEYSEEHVVWDAEKAIWQLIHYKNDPIILEKEKIKSDIKKRGIVGCNLGYMLDRTTDNVFYCIYDKKLYWFDFVYKRQSYNVYWLNPETGEISEINHNREAYIMRDLPVWTSRKMIGKL